MFHSDATKTSSRRYFGLYGTGNDNSWQDETQPTQGTVDEGFQKSGREGNDHCNLFLDYISGTVLMVSAFLGFNDRVREAEKRASPL